MPDKVHIYRSKELAAEIAEERARMREAVARLRNLLKHSSPDTFLGRQHYEIISPASEDE